jgi:hypothetical protein
MAKSRSRSLLPIEMDREIGRPTNLYPRDRLYTAFFEVESAEPNVTRRDVT